MSASLLVSLSACRLRTAEQWSNDMWKAVVDFSCLEETISLPQPFTFQQHVQAAEAFRDHLDNDCKKKVCSVCSMYRRTVDVEEYDLEKVPNLHLLDASGPKTAKHPRDALTTFAWQNVTYCLQPYACRVDGSGDHCTVDICVDCFTDLKNKRVPDESLVCFDTGKLSRCILSCKL